MKKTGIAAVFTLLIGITFLNSSTVESRGAGKHRKASSGCVLISPL